MDDAVITNADAGFVDTPAAGAKTTANVLTGFLGSGKTSLLKRLLISKDLSKTAVLINEFGEVGIDHLLVERLDEDIVLLRSGCVCCSIRGDLKQAIVDLCERRRNGSIPPFDRIVLETTGLADPGPIVATFNADPVLRHQLRLGNIVTVVDAVSGPGNLDTYPEAVSQLAVADRIVLSKTDLVDRAAVTALRQQIGSFNPTAAIIETDETSPVTADLISHDLHGAVSREREVGRWLAAETVAADVAPPLADHTTRHTPQAFCISWDTPLDWASFGLWLSMLLNRHGQQILRVKGLLNVAGVAAPVVVHGVQHTIHKPEHLSAWPDGDTRTRLVFITTGLDQTLVERSFRAFHSMA